jgi:peptidoglycan/LPS O-acetylase OafA/YrhL
MDEMIGRKLDSLNFLRGIAVLSVCFCHFGYALSSGHVFADLFKLFHEYGKYGVQVFFVISGFVIPLSLFKSKYNFSYYGQFLLKRLARLHPPYLVALVVTLLIGYAAFYVRHLPFPETLGSILLSLFYGHVSEINPVFWTLIVEAQFYIFIGIAYVWLTKYPNVSLFVFIPLLLLLSQTFVAEYIRLVEFIGYFLIGWQGFVIYTKQVDVKLNSVGLIVLVISMFALDGIPSGVAALFTISIILFYKGGIPATLLLPGSISYSLYLIHYPIGVKLINLATRYLSPGISWILFPITLVLSLALAWLFWRYIENPWAEYSSAMKYKVPA